VQRGGKRCRIFRRVSGECQGTMGVWGTAQDRMLPDFSQGRGARNGRCGDTSAHMRRHECAHATRRVCKCGDTSAQMRRSECATATIRVRKRDDPSAQMRRHGCATAMPQMRRFERTHAMSPACNCDDPSAKKRGHEPANATIRVRLRECNAAKAPRECDDRVRLRGRCKPECLSTNVTTRACKCDDPSATPHMQRRESVAWPCCSDAFFRRHMATLAARRSPVVDDPPYGGLWRSLV
jgi:hypothetical protein